MNLRSIQAEFAWRVLGPQTCMGMMQKNLGSYQEIGSFTTTTASPEIEKYRRIYGLSGLLGAYSSYSGKSVTVDSSLENAAVYACVKIISEDIGRLPWMLKQTTADDDVYKAIAHPLYQTLHGLVNPDMASGEFVESLTAHACLLGNGYARIEQVGRNKYLFPLQPAQVRIETNTNGLPIYLVRKDINTPEAPIERSRIFHLRGFTFDGLQGDQILNRARHIIGLGSAAQEYAGRFFTNDASVGLILRRPIEAPPLGTEGIETLKAKFKEWYQGLGKAHEPAVLQEGTVVERLLPDPEKIALQDQRTFQLREVARIFRMPLHKLGDLERATFSNIEEQNDQYLSETLAPWVARWRRAVDRCLLTAEERRDGYFAEHNVMALQQGKFVDQANGFARLLEKGVYSINDVRRILSLNKVEGGDKYYIQLNMQAVAEASTGTIRDSGTGLSEVTASVNGR